MLLSSQKTADRNMHRARLISRPSWLLVAALSVTFLSSGCSRSQQSEHASSGNSRRTEVATPFSAEMSLQWDKSSRKAFVLGNLRGHWDGVSDGCGDAMYMRCGTGYKPSNRSIESYEELVTNFYNRYPEDRIIEIQDVLRLLEGDPALTAEDIQKRIKITQNPNR